MALQIIRGIQKSAIRAVIYGTEGIGKSTLAAALPSSLIVDTEDGSKQIDAARTLALDWRAAENAVRELITDSQGFKTVIIDSADWLEKSIIDHMLKTSGKKSIEDYGFGKGYTIVAERISSFLGECDKLIANGVNVVFVAHAITKKVSPPDQTDGFDRYELKLTKQSSPILKEWADLVLFCNYKLHIVEGTDGKTKAQGGKERTMYTTRTAAWDAKNRFGLADELPMQVEHIAHLFTNNVARPNALPPKPPVTPPVSSPKSAPVENTPPPVALASPAQVASLLEAHKNQTFKDWINTEIEAQGVVDISELPESSAATLLADIAAAQAEASSALPADVTASLGAMFNGNEDKANAYLTSVGWIQQGETWRMLKAADAATVIAKKDKFLRAAGIQTK